MKTILSIIIFFFLLNYFQIDAKDVLKVSEIYDERITSAYGINYDDVKLACQESVNKKTCKKDYILTHTDITESEYTDIFVHPLGELSSIDLKSTYQKVKEEYITLKQFIKNIIHLLK
ncbi:MAG: hypothetical protein GX490_07905 [Bacilli bacterium]|nr:hypothetical protein [Bacilli bacterium]